MLIKYNIFIIKYDEELGISKENDYMFGFYEHRGILDNLHEFEFTKPNAIGHFYSPKYFAETDGEYQFVLKLYHNCNGSVPIDPNGTLFKEILEGE